MVHWCYQEFLKAFIRGSFGFFLSDNYIFLEISCRIINKNSYIYVVTWYKVVEMLDPNICKIRLGVVNFDLIFMTHILNLAPLPTSNKTISVYQ